LHGAYILPGGEEDLQGAGSPPSQDDRAESEVRTATKIVVAAFVLMAVTYSPCF
jgi:hypothetical protein